MKMMNLAAGAGLLRLDRTEVNLSKGLEEHIDGRRKGSMLV